VRASWIVGSGVGTCTFQAEHIGLKTAGFSVSSQLINPNYAICRSIGPDGWADKVEVCRKGAGAPMDQNTLILIIIISLKFWVVGFLCSSTRPMILANQYGVSVDYPLKSLSESGDEGMYC
jgi:hypothetical protein